MNTFNNPFPYSDSNKRYHTFDYYMRNNLSQKCARIPLDGGFTCPNIDGAKGAGIKTVAVLYGFGSREEFMEHEAEYIVKNTAEVRKIIFGE